MDQRAASFKRFRIGVAVELLYFSPAHTEDQQKIFVGAIRRHSNDEIHVQLYPRSVDPSEVPGEGAKFALRRMSTRVADSFGLLDRPEEWPRMPGWKAMLYAYGLNSDGSKSEQIDVEGSDPIEPTNSIRVNTLKKIFNTLNLS